jgi:Protein of unknown function (DUF3179)
VFRAEAKGKTLEFDTDGLIGGNEVFKDRETGSHWQQATLEAVSGPLKGTHLTSYPFLLTTWGEWHKQHPDTLVLKPLPGYADRLAAMNKVINQGLSGTGSAPTGAFGHDHRLRPRETIFGLEIGAEAKAFPLSTLRRVHVINDEVGGEHLLIVHQPASDTTTAFVAQFQRRTLKFKAADSRAETLTDLETHSRWNAYGLCISGRLKGARLTSLILEPEFWFAWSEFHPHTAVYTSPAGS